MKIRKGFVLQFVWVVQPFYWAKIDSLKRRKENLPDLLRGHAPESKGRKSGRWHK